MTPSNGIHRRFLKQTYTDQRGGLEKRSQGRAPIISVAAHYRHDLPVFELVYLIEDTTSTAWFRQFLQRHEEVRSDREVGSA